MCAIGTPHEVACNESICDATTPSVLVYPTGYLLNPISLIAFCPIDESSGNQQAITEIPSVPVHGPLGVDLKDLIFSSAPLQNVAEAQVFSEPGGSCKGIMLKYTNGAQRAVGSVRLGMDSPTCTKWPTQICLLRIESHGLQTARTKFFNDIDKHYKHYGSHIPNGWVCSEMKGQVNFYVNHKQTYIKLSCPTNQG